MPAACRFKDNNGSPVYIEDEPQTRRRWRTREAVLARIKELEQEARNAARAA